jgi:hypothetical protein
MKGDWIRPDEGLPEPYREVFVWYEYRSMNDPQRKHQAFGITCYVGCGLDAWNKAGLGQDVRILAWMPLPDEPEKKVRAEEIRPTGAGG